MGGTVKPDQDERDRLAELRKRAESHMDREDTDSPEISPDEARRLVYELRTHQIELEIQNDELRRAQEDLVESRDRFSDLYDFAPVGYVTISHRGMIIDVNLTLVEMVGVERRDLSSQPFTTLIVPDDQDVFYRHRQGALESKGRGTCRLRLQRVDSEPLWVELESVLIDGEGEDYPRLLIAIIDISERKQSEVELRSLEQQLRHKQKLESLGVLAGGIVHDFNNILTAILGNAEMALYELSPMSPARNNIQEIEKSVKHATGVVKQMLAYAGKGRYVVEPIDAGRLVGEMAHLLEISISKKVDLRYNLDGSRPAFNGDVAQIHQVVMNLVINASEAIGDETGVITLSTGVMNYDDANSKEGKEARRVGLGEKPAGGVYTFVEVTDTGCGMDAESIEKIFDPFFSTKFTGRGLGMSAVLGIVRGHHGALKIYSEVGEGSSFMLLFPAIEQTGSDFVVQKPADVGNADWRGSGTILIVDDEEMIRATCKQMLERQGFSVLTAADGREALDVYRQRAEEIKVVLLDLAMPRMDGEETLHKIQNLHPEVKVILFSGYSEWEVSQRFAGKGLAGFVKKPFKMAELAEKLREVLDSQ